MPPTTPLLKKLEQRLETLEAQVQTLTTRLSPVLAQHELEHFLQDIPHMTQIIGPLLSRHEAALIILTPDKPPQVLRTPVTPASDPLLRSAQTILDALYNVLWSVQSLGFTKLDLYFNFDDPYTPKTLEELCHRFGTPDQALANKCTLIQGYLAETYNVQFRFQGHLRQVLGDEAWRLFNQTYTYI